MTKNTTSNGIKRKVKVSQDVAERFNLQKHLIDLLWDEPFYSRILRSLNKVESKEIPTAGVLAVDSEITMWWNRDFLASLLPKQVKGLLKHECLHLVFKHTTDRRKTPHILWNYSTDLAINSIIPYDQLPEGGLVPGYHLKPLSDEDIAEMGEEDIQNFNHLSDLIYSLPRNKTSEFYFQKLINDETIKKMAEDAETMFSFGGFDDHEGWDDIPADQKEMLNEKLTEILKSAVEEANQKGWGSISSETAIELNKLVSKKIKWEDVLRHFCGTTRRDERHTSIKRLNRKYPGVHPGFKKVYKPRIAVYVDESGSMSSEELSRFYGELNNLSSKTDFYMYKFDSVVDDKSGFLWKKGKKLKLNRTHCGGTSFVSVAKHATKNKKNFDGYIIFTDGAAPKPPISHGLKRCWLLLPNCSLTFTKDKADTLIQMKD